MNNSHGRNNMSDQEAWQVSIQRRFDDLHNRKEAARKSVISRRGDSTSQERATKRCRISLHSSCSSDVAATDIPIYGPLTEELSMPASGQLAPCPLCRISESRFNQSDFRKGDWANINVWVDSAIRGCNYCKIIASGVVRNYRPRRSAVDHIKLRIRTLGGPFSNTLVDVRSQNYDVQVLEFHIMEGTCFSNAEA